MRAIEAFHHRCGLTLALSVVLACASAACADPPFRVADTRPSQKVDQSFVFVCDATGSTSPKFTALRVRLSRTIQNLRPAQSFDVLFFGGNGTSSFSGWLKQPANLVVATSPNKNRFSEFFAAVVPHGSDSPLAAVEMAIQEQPDVIYLLTDSLDESDKVAKRIRELNPDRKIRINTIAFLNNDEIKHHVDVSFKEGLKQIAEENGGTFNDVNPDDL